jgi:hypothetical protein
MKPSAALGFYWRQDAAGSNKLPTRKEKNEHNYNKEWNAVSAAKHRGNRRDGVFD